jgi:hypothetical protein
LVALGLGALCFAPWVPTFVFQARHTGTPWAAPAGPGDLIGVPLDFAGTGGWSVPTACASGLLVAAAVVRRRRAGDRDPAGVPLFGLAAATLVAAVAAGAVGHAAFVARYAAVVLPLWLLLVAEGIGRRPRVLVGALGALCVTGLLTGMNDNAAPRTQAAPIARVLNARARPGDLVVFCPDQLGPPVNRLLRVAGLTQLTFPRAIGPERVDWVDYRDVIARTDVAAFARAMVARAGRAVWLVWSDGYVGLGGDCGRLAVDLGADAGPGATLARSDLSSPGWYVNLVRYPGRVTDAPAG